MKKNISVHIGGVLLQVEEDGYEKLKKYLDSIAEYFSTFEDSKEIIDDIECRIAEILLSKLHDKKQTIQLQEVEDLIVTMGTPNEFHEAIGDDDKNQNETYEETTAGKAKRLYRNNKQKLIGGVASGLAYYFGIDTIWIRLIFLASLFNFFLFNVSLFSLFAYIILWIVIPGSDELDEDKSTKKLFRSPDRKVIGGICSGIATYFSVDVVLIRVLFILSIFLFGIGIFTYIVLWIITPEAKTLTEKMKMEGERITLSNIENKIKKNFNLEGNSETTFVKILLFPFRLLASFLSYLNKNAEPFFKFSANFIRIVFGIFLMLVSSVLILSILFSFAVLLGFHEVLEYHNYINAMIFYDLLNMISYLGIISACVVILIPSLTFFLVGLSIIFKKSVISSYVGWGLLGVFLLGIIGLGVTLPRVISELHAESEYIEEKKFKVEDYVPTLKYNELDRNIFDHQVTLRLRGTDDTSNYILNLEFESFGSSSFEAKKNAERVAYNLIFEGEDIIFDSDLSYPNDVPFRFQTLDATFYIPYGKVFRMDNELKNILRNTLHINSYSSRQMEGNNWVFDKQGIKCLTCTQKRSANYYQSGDFENLNYDFENFDEVIIGSEFQFEITRKDDFKVELKSKNKGELDNVYLEQKGDRLEIRYDRIKHWLDDDSHHDVKIVIEMPELAYLKLSGACNGTIDDFDSKKMKIKMSGASKLTAEINLDELILSQSGASKILLSGTVNEAEVQLSGASNMNAFRLITETANIRAGGAAHARVYVKHALKARTSGAGSIYYRGGAEVSVIGRDGSVVRD